MNSKAELASVDAERARTGAAPVITHAAQPDADGLIEYVVVYIERVNPGEADSLSRQMVQGLNLRAITPFSGPALSGFSARMDSATVARLRREPLVRFIEQSVPVVPWDLIPNPPSWGQDRVDQHPAPLNGNMELGWVIRPVAVYVIDSGIRNTHSNNWQARFHPGICTAPGCTSAPADSVVDTLGHGTHVAGTIGGNKFGVSKDVDVYSVRVFIGNSTTIAAILGGINWVASDPRPRKIANMSFGTTTGTSLAIDTAVQALINGGVTAVVAAGNQNIDACTRSPSRVLDAIVVGATSMPAGANDPKASYSNWGACVDLFAPGTNIVSAGAVPFGAATMSGTSMAAPHVTGVAAFYVSQNLAPAAVHTQVVLTDATTGTVSNILASMPGTPNRMLFNKGMPNGHALGPLLSTGVGNPMYGVKTNGQLFLIWNNAGLLQVGNILTVNVVPGSLALGSTDDVWGVNSAGNLEHAWWSAGAWHSETVQVWGGGAHPMSLVSSGQGNPIYGVKTTGQVFIIWRDTSNNTWGVGSIRDITARPGSLRVAQDGSLFGLRPDGNAFQAWWANGQWWEISINVW